MKITRRANKYIITRKGQYAAHIQEAHPLALAEFLEKHNYFKEFENKKETGALICKSEADEYFHREPIT